MNKPTNLYFTRFKLQIIGVFISSSICIIGMSKRSQKPLTHYLKGGAKKRSEPKDNCSFSNGSLGIYFVYQNEQVLDLKLFNFTPDNLCKENLKSKPNCNSQNMKRKITEDLKEIYVYMITTVNRTYFIPYYVKWFYSKLVGILSLEIEVVNEFSNMNGAKKWLEKVSAISLRDMSHLEEKLWKSREEFQLPTKIGLEIKHDSNNQLF